MTADPDVIGTPDPLPPGPQDLQRMILAASGSSAGNHRLGLAVLDTGATETVGSLEAIEYILHCRFRRYGHEDIGVDVNRRKKFKFGNAEERTAESFLLLPQTVQGQTTSLGIYTLDVPGVPVLIGIKTMDRLGAVVDTRRKTLEFTEIFPGVRIPLAKGQNGHLLLDLCQDWADNSALPTQGAEIPRPAASHSRLDTGLSEQNEGDEPPTVQECAHSGDEHSSRQCQLHVHVVDTKSETSAEALIEEYTAEDFVPQVSDSGTAVGPGSADQHGAILGDPHGQVGGEGPGGNRSADGLQRRQGQSRRS